VPALTHHDELFPLVLTEWQGEATDAELQAHFAQLDAWGHSEQRLREEDGAHDDAHHGRGDDEEHREVHRPQQRVVAADPLAEALALPVAHPHVAAQVVHHHPLVLAVPPGIQLGEVRLQLGVRGLAPPLGEDEREQLVVMVEGGHGRPLYLRPGAAPLSGVRVR